VESHGLSAQIRIAPGDYTERGGIAAAHELLGSSNSPTAIFAANDLRALGRPHPTRACALLMPKPSTTNTL